MITPVWFGFHDGSFDLFNPGEAASDALERIAEDGDASLLGPALADATGGTGQGGLVFGPGMGDSPPIFFPGQTGSSSVINLDEGNRYFTFATMVIPSNDFFIGNGMAVDIFDDMGNFVGVNLFVTGAMVWDAGTEVNDEIPLNTAALGQMVPDTGVDENGTVLLAGENGFGFLEGGNVLAARTNGDFNLPGYPIANIRVEVIPEPSAMALLGLGVVGLLIAVRRRK